MSNLESNIAIDRVRSAPIPLDRCGMALACDLLGDRWTMLIIREAFYGVSRFDDLRTDLGIPRGILSERLKKLVREHVMEKRPYREGSARLRHEYHLSPRGRELSLPLIALMQWGDRHLQTQPPLLKIIDKQTGEVLRIGLVTDDGRAVRPTDIDLDIVANGFANSD
jgi:DNA-binding HxlR family transcriptional regulator